GGIINGRIGINEYFKTGKGRLTLRAKVFTENEKSGKQRIIVNEIPYQINKANLLERIAELVNAKTIEGISDLRDESDRDGMRIVIELKKDAFAEVVLNQLFKHTQMQATFGVINLSLVDGQPKVLNFREMLDEFLKHRHIVVTRRTQFELKKAEERAHILEGLKIALDHLDEVISLIRKSKTPEDAKQGLIKKFELSEVQAQAILDMRLQRLTGLERQKIEDEYVELLKTIATLKEILASKARRMAIIKEELLFLKTTYGDERRTEIKDEEESEFSIEDLIAEEDMVITITHSGYCKRLPVTSYRKQQRGGRGAIGIETKEEDFVEHLFIASTHEYILFFTSAGKCYWLKVHEIPQGGKLAKGKPIVNLLALQEGEKVAAMLPVRKFDDQHYIILCTRQGTIKKTVLSAFSNPRKGGIIAIGIDKGDQLIDAALTDGQSEIVLATRQGMAIRFHEEKVRDMGRGAYGVRGITLEEKDYLIGMVVVRREATLLVVTEKG
ncbi:MAG: DNA gyrase subunit A, partial [candidate division Zixibacteria bacterium]|nr:DNA gyrase subunit A [candidate division Zixibacteria bacterium]